MSEFPRLFEAAAKKAEIGPSTVDFIDSFAEVLDYIKQHAEVRAEAEAAFLDALAAPGTPWELIAFCMHELRWPAVQNKVAALLAASDDPRDARVFQLVLGAFEDDWEERDLYSYTFSRGGD